MKKSLFLLSFILLLGMLLPVHGDIDSKNYKINQNDSSSLLAPTQETTEYSESMYTSFSSEGYIYSTAYFSGNILSFDSVNIDNIIPVEVDDSISSVDLNVYQPHSPTDQNMYISFYFQITSLTDAKSYAESILNNMGSQISISNIEFESYYSYDNSINVEYRGHIDWIDMKQLIGNSLPNDQGGLAASLNVSTADNFYFNIWKNSDGYSSSIGVDFYDRVSKIEGGHAFSITDYLPVSNFSVSDLQTSLFIDINLPYVSNLILSVTNSSGINVIIDTNEPTNDYDGNVYVSIEIQSDTVLNEIDLSFDYKFLPYDWKNNENLYWNIDQRGYSELSISSRGYNRIAPTFNLLANQSIYDDVLNLHFSINSPNADGIQSMNIQIQFSNEVDYVTANTTTQFITNELASLGISFTYNGNYTDWDVDDAIKTLPNDTTVFYNELYYGGQISDKLVFGNFINHTYGYNNSALLSYSNVTVFDSFRWSMDYYDFGLTPSFYLDFDELNYYKSTPNSSFDQNIETVHQVDLLQPHHLNWNGSIPWNNQTEEIRLHVSAPYVGNFTDISFVPTESYGQGYSTSLYKDSYNQYNSFDYTVWLYSGEPEMRNDDSTYSLVSDFYVNFSNEFYGDNVDLEAPGVNTLYYKNASSTETSQLNEYENYYYADYGQVFSGIQQLAINLYDYSPTWYNGTHSIPRFPSSGIQNVTGYFYRSDAPVNHQLFTKTLEYTHNSSWVDDTSNNQMWDATLDTTSLPDGEYQLQSELYDNNDNYGSQYTGSFTIDNYDDSYQAAEIFYSDESPQEGDGVADIVRFNFTVKDDAGIYAVIAYNNLGGYVQEAVSTWTNASGTYSTYSFMVDTEAQGVPENGYMTISIEVLDMDGHWSYYDVQVIVDNIPSGEAPTVGLIAPIDGHTVNNTRITDVTFVANVTDDIGIKSIKLQLSGPSTKEYSMFLNEDTGYFEFTADISLWEIGDYVWQVVVTDLDENTHTITSNSYTISVIGDPSLNDNILPNIVLSSHSDGDEVSGEVTIEATVTDDVEVAQVILSTDNIEDKRMSASGSNTYTATWDSTTVADGEVSFTITAVDSNGNTETLDFNLVAKNGRTATAPELGLPGFELYLAISSLFVLIPVIKRRR